MPVAKMLKLEVLTPLDKRDELVELLYHLGAVHVEDLPAHLESQEALQELVDPCLMDARETKLALSKTEFLLELLERFEEGKGGFFSAFLSGRVHLTYEEFLAVEREVDLEGLYRELEQIEVRLRHVESSINESRRTVEALRNWVEFDLRLSEASEFERCSLFLVIVPEASFASWAEEMEQVCPLSAWEEVRRTTDSRYLAVLVHQEQLASFEELSSKHGLEEVSFPGLEDTPQGEMMRVKKRLEELETEKATLVERISEKMPLKPKLLALYDYYSNLLKKEEAKNQMLRTERTVLVGGWVEETRKEELEKALRSLGEDLDVSFSSPSEQEIPPTKLVNRKRTVPAETIINLFGLPHPAETDPTPFVAPFFVLFFGMCISDVGYGLLLALAAWWALRKLDLSAAARNFVRLILYCGLSAMAVGVFTRGYFGIEGEMLPGFLKFPGSQDVLNNPVPIMLVCAALGLLHISIGVAIEMYDNIRNNSIWAGLFEQGTTLLMWAGLALLALGAGAKVDPLRKVGIYALAGGAAGVVLLSNYKSKSLLGKFFGGLYNLYGLFGGTIGDVASYLRLYALGMATVAIGSVVNRMALMIKGIPVLGIILMVVILAGGHLFNLLINLLSAFVHPLRLQYVEFFSKFYEDGGVPFRPLGLETSKVVIDDR